jgi:hypothetical protein
VADNLLAAGPSGSLGGSSLMPSSPAAPYPAPTYNQGQQGVNNNNQGLGFNSGMVNLQGTGYVPQGQQDSNAVGGFQTAGYQYGIQGSGPIQGSAMNNSGQMNTQQFDPARMPVGSVMNGQQYYNPAQDAYVAQARRSLDPQWQQSQESQESQLTNMGLTRGSQAWDTAMQNFGRAKNDAYGSAMNQGIMNAGAEAARMQGMDINAGNFANQAAQQNFTNELTAQQAYNAALGQQQSMDESSGNFANQAQQQQWNQTMGEAQLNNAALGQQQGFQTQQDVAKMGLEGAKAGAAASVSAAGASSAASRYATDAQRAIAAGSQNLQGRGLDMQQQRQNYDITTGMYNLPGDTQARLANGAAPNSNIPGMGNFNNTSNPSYQNTLSSQQGANSQYNGGYGGMVNGGLALGGAALQNMPRWG